jgi:signal transduction histidine kinase
MFSRRSLKLPITLGVLMIITIIALTIGWVLLLVSQAMADSRWAPLYWTLLTVGTSFLVFVLVGVIMYLSLSVETINLNRRQSNFIDSVTHELKSPIASLKLYLQTLGRRNVSLQSQEDFFRFMLDDVERLDTLINNLLDAANLDHRVVDTEIENVDLAQSLSESIETVCLRYRVSPDIVRLDAEPVIVRARPVDLELIFRNLIDNAVKYAGDDPLVEVEVRRQSDNRCVTRVSDNGKGVPAKLRRKIFGRFYRLGEELERETPGMGLGLFIVRTIVRRLHGKISVRERDLSPGTVFEVVLPAQWSENADSKQEEAAS